MEKKQYIYIHIYCFFSILFFNVILSLRHLIILLHTPSNLFLLFVRRLRRMFFFLRYAAISKNLSIMIMSINFRWRKRPLRTWTTTRRYPVARKKVIGFHFNQDTPLAMLLLRKTSVFSMDAIYFYITPLNHTETLKNNALSKLASRADSL